jgi:hypothetical protein
MPGSIQIRLSFIILRRILPSDQVTTEKDFKSLERRFNIDFMLFAINLPIASILDYLIASDTMKIICIL